MLPTYQRFNSSNSSKFRSIRVSERILIFLVFISFLVIVLFGFFLLPDLTSSSGVIQVYNKFKKAGPEIFIPAPPIERNRDKVDFDRIRLEQKIQSEFNDVESELDKPDIQQPNKVPIVPIPVPDPLRNPHHEGHKKSPPHTDSSEDQTYSVDGQDQDPATQKRRDKVKEVS